MKISHFLYKSYIDALSIGEEKICKSHAPQISEFKGKSKVTYIENIFGAYLCNYCKIFQIFILISFIYSKMLESRMWL